MTEDESLQAEIERISKLRGRPAPQRGTAETVARRMGQQRLRSLFYCIGHTPADAREETLVFDALPARSRDFIRESPVFISPSKWADLLLEYSEDALLDMVRQCITGRGQELVRQRYGHDHPQAQSKSFTMPVPKHSRKMARDSERVRVVARRMMR